jgi:hypothetical protein
MNNVITIQPERRLCEVDGKLGYFHCWEQYAVTVPEIGPLSGGQVSRLYGIVEFSKSIKRVNPEDIQFVDEENRDLAALEEEASKVTKETKNECN